MVVGEALGHEVLGGGELDVRLLDPGASEAGDATKEAAKTGPGVGWH